MVKALYSFQKCVMVIFFASCFACGNEEDAISYNVKGMPYPKGVKSVDLTSMNDCTLPWCSVERVTRLELNNVTGYLRLDSILQVTFTWDSSLEFHICNKNEIDFHFEMEEFQKVKFSGIAKDACGYLYSNVPIEEEYFIDIIKLERL